MSSAKEPLNKRLERLRKQRGLSAKALAKLIEVPASTYREWEYGRGLKLPPLRKISEVLAISVTELVTGEAPVHAELVGELEQIENLVRQSRLKLSSFV